MLSIKHKRTSNLKRAALSISAMSLLGGGLYMLSLVAAPIAAPILTMKPIDVKALPSPEETGDRIVIPKIGVNIAYGKGEASLDSGAEWRMPGNGNPMDGGNFVIAAHRFSIQPTPLATIEKSPFYHIDKLADGDKEPFQQKTFTLHDEQAAIVDDAVTLARTSPLADTGLNENSNGNALALICQQWLGNQNG